MAIGLPLRTTLRQIWTPDDGDSRHHLRVDASERRVVLVDDLRSFVDGRSAEVARTSAAGVQFLDRYRDRRLDELWLDHDGSSNLGEVRG